MLIKKMKTRLMLAYVYNTAHHTVVFARMAVALYAVRANANPKHAVECAFLLTTLFMLFLYGL